MNSDGIVFGTLERMNEYLNNDELFSYNFVQYDES